METFDKILVRLNSSIKKYLLLMFYKLYYNYNNYSNHNTNIYNNNYNIDNIFFNNTLLNFINKVIFKNNYRNHNLRFFYEYEPSNYINVYKYLHNSSFLIYLIKYIIEYYNENYEFCNLTNFINNISLHNVLNHYVYIKIKNDYIEDFANFKIKQNKNIMLSLIKNKINEDISFKIFEFL